METCLKFFLALGFCFAPNAQTSHVDNRAFTVEDFSAPVVADSRATYIDLLREIFPNAETDAGFIIADRAVRLRNLEFPKEITERKTAVEISIVEALWIADEGEERLVLLIDARSKDPDAETGDPEFSVLAVFSIKPKAKLIDAAEIDFDHFTEFWHDAPLLPLRKGETAFWIRATHHNSSEGFQSFYLLDVKDNHLRLASDKGVFLQDVKLCESDTLETFDIDRAQGFFNRHRVYRLRVRTEIKPDENCDSEKPRGSSRVKNRYYQLRWNARQQRYQTITGRKSKR